MGVLTTGNTYSTADQVTASNLNSTVNDATFQSAAVDNTSTQLSGGAIIVKDEGITQDKIAPDAVGTDELANDVVINTSGSITSNSVSVADGSESVPSITNTGDTNTGIYFPAENSIALTAGAGATLTSTNTAITINVPTSIVSATQSNLTLQGGDANSKNLIFKKASAQQGKISAVGDELKCYAGTSTTESLRLTTTGAFIPGSLAIGTDDTTAGTISAYGDGTGSSEGGQLNLYIAADHDSTYNRWQIDAYEDDLRIFTDVAEVIRVTPTGNVGIGTAAPTEQLDLSGDAIRIRTAQTPASATATGTAGTVCWDASYIYVCTATNTWKRVAISTW